MRLGRSWRTAAVVSLAAWIAAITAGRLFVNLMGAAVRANYFAAGSPAVREAATADLGM